MQASLDLARKFLFKQIGQAKANRLRFYKSYPFLRSCRYPAINTRQLRDLFIRAHSHILKTHTGSVPLIVFAEQRSEEHTSELQSRGHLVCRLLLEKKTANAQ